VPSRPASDPSAPVRLALVGTGNIAGARHMPAARQVGGDVEVVAVTDVDADRARAFAEEWAIPRSYDRLGDLLAAESPDVVVVCTPPVAHREAIVESLAAGSWVWCEKPPTLSLAEYDEIQQHEHPDGPYVSYVFQHRFGAAALRLKDQIASGELGRPLVGLCNTMWYRGDDYFDLPWRGRWETEGGGPTLGHGIHQMDLMLSLLGEWTEVRAMMGTLARSVETEDVSMASVALESGAMMSVVNSLLSPREESYLRFDFADATVELSHTYGYGNDDWSWTPARHVEDERRIAAWRPVDDTRSSHGAQLAQLVAAFRRGERPAASGQDGRRSLEFITGLYRSALTGEAVRRDSLVPGDPFYSSLNGASRVSA